VRVESVSRCSDKGFLAMPIRGYLELLDWTGARQVVPSKRQLHRAPLRPSWPGWIGCGVLVRRAGDRFLVGCFCSVAGRSGVASIPIDVIRTQRRIHLAARPRTSHGRATKPSAPLGQERMRQSRFKIATRPSCMSVYGLTHFVSSRRSSRFCGTATQSR